MKKEALLTTGQWPVRLYPKVRNRFIGYFDPINIVFNNTNRWFSWWSNRCIGEDNVTALDNEWILADVRVESGQNVVNFIVINRLTIKASDTFFACFFLISLTSSGSVLSISQRLDAIALRCFDPRHNPLYSTSGHCSGRHKQRWLSRRINLATKNVPHNKRPA